jgi:hypothetical protein
MAKNRPQKPESELVLLIRRIVREELSRPAVEPPSGELSQPTQEPQEEWLTHYDVMEVLSFSYGMVTKWRHQGLLVGYKKFGKTLFKRREVLAAHAKVKADAQSATQQAFAAKQAAKEQARLARQQAKQQAKGQAAAGQLTPTPDLPTNQG